MIAGTTLAETATLSGAARLTNQNCSGLLAVTASPNGGAAYGQTDTGELSATATLSGAAALSPAVGGSLALTATSDGEISQAAGLTVAGGLAVTATTSGTGKHGQSVAGTTLSETATLSGTARVNTHQNITGTTLAATATLSGAAKIANQSATGSLAVTATLSGAAVLAPAISGALDLTATANGTARANTHQNITGALDLTATVSGEASAATAEGVTYDSVGAGNRATGSSATLSTTWPHTISTSNANTVVIVAAECSVNQNYTDTTLYAKYGGIDMEPAFIYAYGATTARAAVGVFYLFNPPTGPQTVGAYTAGTATKTAVAGQSVAFQGAAALREINQVAATGVTVVSDSTSCAVALTANGASLTASNQTSDYRTGSSVGGVGDYISVQHAPGAASVSFTNTGTASTPCSVGLSISPAQAKIATLSDNFASKDTTKWLWGSAAAVASGQLQLTLNAAFDGTINSAATYDLTGGAVSVQLATAGDTNATAETNFGITAADVTGGMWIQAAAYYIGVANSQISLVEVLAQTFNVYGTITYSSTNHKYLRLREAKGCIFAETSADNATWNLLYAKNALMPLTGVTVVFTAGIASGTSATPALFDDVAGAAIAPVFGTWKSGVYADTDPTAEANFETWLGRQCGQFVTYVTRGTWTDMLDNWWADDRLHPSQGLNIGIPLWPTDGNVTTDYTTQWTTFTGQLQAGDVIRLGWEMNLPVATWYWAATSTNWTNWQACWKRAYNAIKAANPDVLVCLCLNAGASQTSVTNSTIVTALAGYIDLLGVDFYWWYMNFGDSESSWTELIDGDGGLNWIATQAQSNGVQIDIGEWAIAPVADSGSGDGTFFINHMFRWFYANDPLLHSENYFNDTAGTAYVYPTTQNPLASAAYESGITAFLGTTISGALELTATADGTANTHQNVTGALELTATISGEATKAGGAIAAGSLAVTATATGSATLTQDCDGALAVTADTTGAARVTNQNAAGTTTAVTATVTGDATYGQSTAGSLAVTAAPSGTARFNTYQTVTGSLAVTVNLSGDATKVSGLAASGSLPVTVTGSGTGQLGQPAGGALAVTATTSGAAHTTNQTIGGELAITATTGGTGRHGAPITGSLAATATTSSTSRYGQNTSGSLTVTATASGTTAYGQTITGVVLEIVIDPTGGVEPGAGRSGALAVTATLDGAIRFDGVVGGALALIAIPFGDGAAFTGLYGNLAVTVLLVGRIRIGPVPAERQWTVPADDRTWRVPADDRTWTVPADDRTWTVPADDRAWTVPADDRAWAVPADNRTTTI